MKLVLKLSLCVLVVLSLLAPGEVRAQSIAPPREADFSRLSKAEGEPISFVDSEGTVREGVLISASADAITVKFASGERVFTKSAIASADRLRDGTGDGVIKGAIVGAVIGAMILGSGADGGFFARSVAVYGAFGWFFDALNTNRQPIYRAAPAEAAVKLSLRF